MVQARGCVLTLTLASALLSGCSILEEVDTGGPVGDGTAQEGPDVRDSDTYEPAPHDAPPQSFFDPVQLVNQADVDPMTESSLIVRDDPDLPPVGEWRPLDAIAARIGDRTILWSEIRDRARAMSRGEAIRPEDLRRVLVREAIDEAWAQLGRIQGGPTLTAQIKRYQADRRKQEIELNGGFQNLEAQTTAVGSTLSEGDRETERQILTQVAQREYVHSRIGGSPQENAHLLATPADMRKMFDLEHGGSEATEIQVQIELVKATPLLDEQGLPVTTAEELLEKVEAFCDAFSEDAATPLPEGFSRQGTRRVAPDDSGAIAFLRNFARDSDVGEVHAEPSASGYWILRNAGVPYSEKASFNDPNLQRSLRQKLANLHTQNIQGRALSYGILQIPIWPDEVRRMVLAELYAR